MIKTVHSFGNNGKSINLYLPSPEPVGRWGILWLHGGGWIGGDKDNMDGIAQYWCDQHGAVCASANYELAAGGAYTDPIRAAVDARQAWEWFVARPEVDPLRCDLAGTSAGGHVAAQAVVGYGLSEAVEPRSLILFYPPTDLMDFNLGGPGAELGIVRFGGVEPARHASPVRHMRYQMPQTIVYQGTVDSVVPAAQAKTWQQRMAAYGGFCQLEERAGWAHGFYKPENLAAFAGVNVHLASQWFGQRLGELG